MGRWKAKVRRDLGLRDPSQAQATILEAAARAWVLLRQLDDWLAAQDGSLPARELFRAIDQRRRLAYQLTHDLERLGHRRGPLARYEPFIPYRHRPPPHP
jgi:hypothetical protein